MFYLDDLEAEVAFVQHDDLVLVRAVIDHVSEGEQRVAAGQHGLPPGGVTFMADYQAAAVVCDGLIQDARLLCLLETREVILQGREHHEALQTSGPQPNYCCQVYLMQLEAHSDCRSHHFLQKVQISEHPFIFCGDAEVAFKQGVEPIQKGFQASWCRIGFV